MRIAIDGRLVSYRRGIGNFVYHLLQEFALICDDTEFIVYVDSQSAVASIPVRENWKIVNLGGAPYPLWEQVLLPAAVIRDRPDILHSPANTGPLFLPSRTKLVLTIHDVMYMLSDREVPAASSLYHRAGRHYRRLVVPFAARRAAKVTTVSWYSRDDIARVLGLSPSDVTVMYEAPNQACQPLEPHETLMTRQKMGIERPFILALAAVDPRKNTTRIIDAFARFRAQSEEAFQLVLVGLPAVGQKRFHEEARRLGIEGDVVIAGFVEERDLVSLYSAARMFAYPSLYEGFGLPLLEAMACDTPVIASPNGSLAEIAGDAALMVDPLNVDGLAEAFRRIAVDEELRDDLIRRGRLRVREFSWRSSARQMLDVYKAAAAEGTPREFS